jgi:hypothetical protein
MKSTTALKEEVRRSRPPGDPLRECILAEPDELTEAEYRAKLRPWLTLLDSVSREC